MGEGGSPFFYLDFWKAIYHYSFKSLFREIGHLQKGAFMIRDRKNLLPIFVFLTTFLFLSASCSNLPLIGKKKEQKGDKIPEGKTVSVEGMEGYKGVNPSKPETPPAKKPSAPTPPSKKEPETRIASTPMRPSYGPSLPFFQMGFKRKVAILDFENKTTYKEEKIGEAVADSVPDRSWQMSIPVLLGSCHGFRDPMPRGASRLGFPTRSRFRRDDPFRRFQSVKKTNLGSCLLCRNCKTLFTLIRNALCMKLS